MAAAAQDMAEAVDGLIGHDRRKLDLGDLGFTTLRPVIVASAPWGDLGPAPERHFDACIALVIDAARALLQATGDLSPPPTRQQLWTWYLVIDEDQAGAREVVQLRLFDDAYFGSSRATGEQAERAALQLGAAWSGNPAETYHDLRLSARRAAYAEGDYVDAVLKAAAACETLIKHVAWQITWEAAQKIRDDPAPAAMGAGRVFDAKPSGLIGAVLSTRLHGNWASNNTSQPIGAWRVHVAKTRNAVLHRGFRVTEAQAFLAVEAMSALETHLMDALGSRASTYPRSALLLVGRAGLERRSTFESARAVYEHESLDELLREYLAWIDANDVGATTD